MLAVVIIALVCIAIAAFLCCYMYPVVLKCYGSRTAKGGRGGIKPQALASARSLFGLRPQMMSPPRKLRLPRTPELLARHGLGRLDMRIARPQPALSHSRGSLLSPSFSPSLSSSCSSSPSSSPTSLETPPMYSPSPISEVVVAPVDVDFLGQTAESRTTPKKGGVYYDNH
jgi:hypothetical protein